MGPLLRLVRQRRIPSVIGNTDAWLATMHLPPVTWTIEGLQTPADRSWVLRQILGVDHDVAANQACILHIHHLMKRFPELNVVPAHDENVIGRLPRFPAFQG